jgi:hypothetical protein
MTRRWTAVAAAWLLCHAALAAGHFGFAIVGDTPYTSSERELMPRMLALKSAEFVPGTDLMRPTGTSLRYRGLAFRR